MYKDRNANISTTWTGIEVGVASVKRDGRELVSQHRSTNANISTACTGIEVGVEPAKWDGRGLV